MDKDFERVLFSYLDGQEFIQIDDNDSVYFFNSEDDEFAEIRYSKSDGWCFIYIDLIEKISSFFSLHEFDSKKVISRWVENTLYVEVKHTTCMYDV